MLFLCFPTGEPAPSPEPEHDSAQATLEEPHVPPVSKEMVTCATQTEDEDAAAPAANKPRRVRYSGWTNGVCVFRVWDVVG